MNVTKLVQAGILSLHAVLIWWLLTQAFPYAAVYMIVGILAAIAVTFYAVIAMKATESQEPKYPSATRARQGK